MHSRTQIGYTHCLTNDCRLLDPAQHTDLASEHSRLCAELRKRAASAVGQCILEFVTTSRSERECTDLLQIALHDWGISDHWYPVGLNIGGGYNPRGSMVLFDTSDEPTRSSLPNFRDALPREDQRWEGQGYIYVSPFSIAIEGSHSFFVVFGDFGSSIYVGTDKATIAHLRGAYDRTEWLLHWTMDKRSLSAADLYAHYKGNAVQGNLSNVALSISSSGTQQDPSTNIGHNFPLVLCTSRDKGFARSSVEYAKVFASRSRSFIDLSTKTSVGMGLWTLESRETRPDFRYGMISFHRLFTAGDSAVAINDHRLYRDFFSMIGMRWIFDGTNDL